MIHIGDKIIESEIVDQNTVYYIRGQRQYTEDRVQKSKAEILSQDGIDIDAFLNASANAETYEKPRDLSHGEGQ